MRQSAKDEMRADKPGKRLYFINRSYRPINWASS
jgi:hypothetical protein